VQKTHLLSKKQPDYFPAIDFLRGLGALAILVWHYHHFYFTQPYYGPKNGKPVWDFARQPFYDFLAPLYHHGGWAVQFFWLLSGFVFCFVYLEKSYRFERFFILRFSRLYPLHLISLLLVLILQYCSLYLVGQFQIIEINDAYHFFLNLFFIQHWGFQEGFSFNSPSWSVSIEELVYWAFFVVFMIFDWRNLRVLYVVLIALILLPIFELYASAFLYFFVGVSLHLIQLRLNLKRLACLIGIVGILTLCSVLLKVLLTLGYITLDTASLLFSYYVALGYFLDVIFLLFFSFLILCAIWLDRSALLSNASGFFREVGSLTYPIYMLHLPIQIFILTIVTSYSISRQYFDNEFVFCTYFLVVISISRLCHRYIERPAQKFIRRKYIT
jgi:peptidoglycan/LPS O-acetylase OafA/YrhL